MRRATLLSLTAALALGPALTGCAGAAIGAAGAYGLVRYDQNRMQRDFDVHFDEAWGAVHASLAELGYPTPSILAHSADEGQLKTEDVWVGVQHYPQGRTYGYTGVAVRVGTFENESHRQRSARILEAVGRRLGQDAIVFE